MVLQGEVPPLQTEEPVPLEIDELRLALLEAEEERRIQSAKEAVQLLQCWPGYHHAGLELEALVQSFIACGSATRCPAEDDGDEEDSSDNARPSSSESVLRQADPRAAAETMQAGAEQTDTSLELSTIAHFPPRASRRRSWAVAALLLLGGIGGTLLGLATATDDRHTIEFEPDAPAESEPAPQPVAPPFESELSVEDPSIPDAAPRVLVWVEFVAKEFPFVDIKVNGRVLELQPESRVRLPIGSFNVYLRTDKNAEWIKAGRITLEPAHQYRVEMRRPSALTMVDLGK
jgi:serine/threonine-protein kinase